MNIVTVCAYSQSRKGTEYKSHAHVVNGKWVNKSLSYKENQSNISHGCCPECFKNEIIKARLAGKKANRKTK